jgi:hypothetical protein
VIAVAGACSVAVCAGALQVRSAAGQGSPYSPSLDLRLDKKLVVGHRATLRATGTAPEALAVWIVVDPSGRRCRATVSATPSRAITLVSGVPVAGQFSVSGRYRPRRAGSHSFCAYLSRGEDVPGVVAGRIRTVKSPPLAARVARRTIRVALRRHDFAERVIDEVDPRCRRRDRSTFACRFEAAFRGYRLEGRGRVQAAGKGVSYRFRVKAQGVRLVLTDENERGGSG